MYDIFVCQLRALCHQRYDIVFDQKERIINFEFTKGPISFLFSKKLQQI